VLITVSFKLFIYYSTLCGAWAALAGWGVGWALTQPGGPFAVSTSGLAQNVLPGLFLGVLVALALGIIDGFWNLSGRRYARVLVRGSITGLLGGIGAGTGAAVGYLLVRWTPNDIAVVIGWTLTGLLIGTAPGMLDYVSRLRGADRSGGGRRKLVNGLLGGTLGGASGGVLYVGAGYLLPAVFSNRSPENLVSPAPWGFTALGACIGLFIGLAQVVMKEAWIRVEAGRRLGSDLILSKDETTIGRAESCDLGLFGDPGVERLHARIVLKDARYLISDVGTDEGTYLNDRRLSAPTVLQSGDSIRVGASILRFREKRKKTVRRSGLAIRS
jgi:hypothetical protein